MRTKCNPRPQSHTGLPQLDKIINTFRYPIPQATSHLLDTSVFQLLNEHSPGNHARRNQEPLDHDEHDQAHDVPSSSPPTGPSTETLKPITIHIPTTTASSKIATNALIQHLIALAILPTEHGGQNATAVYIDLTHTFSATKLHKACTTQIQQHASNTNTKHEDADIESMARSALQHLHILTATSTPSLLHTLDHLPTYLLTSTTHHSSLRPLTLLVLNDIDTFTPQDRLAASLARLETTDSHLFPSISPLTLQRSLISTLTTLQSRFNCVVLYTTTTTTTEDNENTTDPFASNALFTLRANRTMIPRFAPQMGLEECTRDRERRREAVRAGKWWVAAVSKAGGDVRSGFSIRFESEGVIVQ